MKLIVLLLIGVLQLPLAYASAYASNFDPFAVPVLYQNKSKAGSSGADNKLSLRSIMIIGSSKTANINGELLEEGDTFKQYIVESIDEDAVVLSSGGLKTTVTNSDALTKSHKQLE